MNIKTISLGCRLNTLESEKIAAMLAPAISAAIVINTCSVTAAAEKQSAQTVRAVARDNPRAPVFITGCGATRNPALFSEIVNTIVIPNSQKMNLDAYIGALYASPCQNTTYTIDKFRNINSKLSKKFIQIQNGCNHNCTYCITRQLRGKQTSFKYDIIYNDVRAAINDGFAEIVLTGVDIASYNSDSLVLSELCEKLLKDFPEIKHLRLSSIDPASPDIPKIIALVQRDLRMMPHLHLSMQSGSDTILRAMGRRHTADMVRTFIKNAPKNITYSWDIICGFPGETDELFNETIALGMELCPVRIHAFPYSPRPNTIAAKMPGQISRTVSKERVHNITRIANINLGAFMKSQIGKVCSVLMEENNIGRTPNDIEVKIPGTKITPHIIYNVELINISDLHFIGKIC